MSGDVGSKEHDAPREDSWRLPEVLDVKITNAPYQAEQFEYFESHFAQYSEVIQIDIKTNGEFPIRALSPALYVGEVELTEGEAIGENVYRFLAFEFDELEEGATISLGWANEVGQRQMTDFHFQMPPEEADKDASLS